MWRSWEDQSKVGIVASKADQSLLGTPPVHGTSSVEDILDNPPMMGLVWLKVAPEAPTVAGTVPPGVAGGVLLMSKESWSHGDPTELL